jgi:hypothetical protein
MKFDVDVTCVGVDEDQFHNILNSNTPKLAHVLPVEDYQQTNSQLVINSSSYLKQISATFVLA